MVALNFRERLQAGRPLVLDGATGTELTRRGIDTSLPLWSARALIEAPETLRQIHRDYLAAGADVITANTFRTHRRSLAAAGLGKRAADLTRQAVEITASVVEETGRGFVAGSVAPLEDCYAPRMVPPDDQLRQEHREMVRRLMEAGVDLLLIETMNTVREASIATEVAVATGLPTMVGLVCGRSARLLSGESAAAAAAALSLLRPDALAINCTPTPDLHRALGELAAHSDLPVGAYGNVGYADDVQGWVNTDSVDPVAYSKYAERWLQMGVRLVGGCCGTGPAHISALRELVDSQSPGTG
ncbi:MAG: homocysteine S-methyltransferase family protein [Acidobacteriota bacterium]